MLSETSVRNAIVKGCYCSLYNNIRCLKLHQHRLSTMQGVRKTGIIPPEDSVMEQRHRNKLQTRLFQQFCNIQHFFSLAKIGNGFRIQQDNDKLLRKLTEISQGKQVRHFSLSCFCNHHFL